MSAPRYRHPTDGLVVMFVVVVLSFIGVATLAFVLGWAIEVLT